MHFRGVEHQDVILFLQSQFPRMMYEYVDIVFRSANTTYEYVIPEENGNRSFGSTSMWDGIMMTFANADADYAVRPVLPDYEKSKTVHFHFTNYQTSIICSTRLKDVTLKESDILETIISGDWKVYVLVIFTIFVYGCIHKLLAFRYAQIHPPSHITFFHLAAYFLYQSIPPTLKMTSQRLAFATFSIFVIVLVCAVYGSIKTELTTPEMHVFTSIADIVKTPDAKVVLLDSGFATMYLKDFGNEEHKVFLKMLEENGNILFVSSDLLYNMQSIRHMFYEEEITFCAEADAGYFALRMFCDVYPSARAFVFKEKTLRGFPNALSTRKTLEPEKKIHLKKRFDILNECGFHRFFLETLIQHEVSKCVVSELDEVTESEVLHALPLKSFRKTLAVWAFGSGIAGLTFFVEMAVFRIFFL